MHNRIRPVYGTAIRGPDGEGYVCSVCGACVCTRLFWTLEDGREPKTCPNCDALLDWSELIG